MSTAPAQAPVASRAALVWAVGMLGYVLAVMQRTTFGVSGLDAADRFGISPATLSAFVFLQVAVYIAAHGVQPVGVASQRHAGSCPAR